MAFMVDIRLNHQFLTPVEDVLKPLKPQRHWTHLLDDWEMNLCQDDCLNTYNNDNDTNNDNTSNIYMYDHIYIYTCVWYTYV